MPGISLDDKGAWDDSALINSWDEAVAEYQKYHSIQRSGKRLEDVLREEELKQLREEHGDLMEVEETAERNNHADQEDHEDAELPQQQTNGGSGIRKSEVHAEEQAASGHQEYRRTSETVAAHKDPLSTSMPQALLGTVQDENLKNLMMSWYYAGYYTGLYTGQQQAASNEATPEDKQ